MARSECEPRRGEIKNPIVYYNVLGEIRCSGKGEVYNICVSSGGTGNKAILFERIEVLRPMSTYKTASI